MGSWEEKGAGGGSKEHIESALSYADSIHISPVSHLGGYICRQ